MSWAWLYVSQPEMLWKPVSDISVSTECENVPRSLYLGVRSVSDDAVLWALFCLLIGYRNYLHTRADSQSIPSCHALVNQQLPPNALCHNLLQVCIEMTAEITCHSNSFIYWNSVDFVLGKNVCIEALLKWNRTTNCKPLGQSTLQTGVIPKYKINGILFLWGIYDWLITVSMTRWLFEIIEPHNAQSCHNILVWPIL